jgi:hypothetical protein
MLPFLLIPLGIAIVWKLARDSGLREADDRRMMRSDIVVAAVEEALERRGHAAPTPIGPASHHLPMLPPRSSSYETHSVAQYMEHLRECMMAAAALNTVRPAAINADMSALENAPHEAVFALAVLSQPMDTLTIQRDLNVLGANPPLIESGVRDAQTVEAIKGLQERFRQPPTGHVDPGTAVAIRYSVGVVHGQNQSGAMG